MQEIWVHKSSHTRFKDRSSGHFATTSVWLTLSRARQICWNGINNEMKLTLISTTRAVAQLSSPQENTASDSVWYMKWTSSATENDANAPTNMKWKFEGALLLGTIPVTSLIPNRPASGPVRYSVYIITVTLLLIYQLWNHPYHQYMNAKWPHR